MTIASERHPNRSGRARPYRHALSGLLALAILGSSQVGGAAPNPVSAQTTLKIEPLAIRRYLLENSNSVLSGLNSVYQAKEAVNVARGNLLPSISLGGAMSAVSSFGLSSVTLLLPFLLPGNWANMDASQDQLSAAGTAFYLAELNSYASAYALYITILADTETLEIAKRQAGIAEQIEMVTNEQLQLGNATAGDLSLATSQAKTARANVLHLNELLAAERASFRVMLSLPTSRLDFVPTHPAPLAQEAWTSQRMFDATFRKSPEARQVISLIAAAKAGEWSATFSFLGTGISLAAPTNASNQVAFNNLRESSASGSVNLGFALPATIRLSSLNTEALRLRLKEVKIEESAAIDTALVSVASAKAQLSLAETAEREALNAFQEAVGKYRQGQINLISVATVSANVLTAGIGRVAAQGDLDNRRLTIKRILISDEFAAIPKCEIPARTAGDKDLGDWFRNLFDGDENRISVDQLCRTQRVRAPRAAKVQT